MTKNLLNILQNIIFNKNNNGLRELGRWNSVTYNKNKEKITKKYSEWANKDNCFGNGNGNGNRHKK